MRLRPGGYDGSELEYRFDLYGALYLLCSRWHSGAASRGYRILSRLSTARYSRGPLSDGFESETERMLYRDLAKRYKNAL